MSRNAPAGFTVIELLVVVTIIVLLLSLLAPALEGALYRAELARCSANLKAVASGAVMYSQSNKQYFPYRDAIETNPLVGGSQTNQGLNGTENVNANGEKSNSGDFLQKSPGYRFRRMNTLAEGLNHDDRARLRPYISMKSMLDPLCGSGKIDLDNVDGANTVYIYADYALFFGMRYERYSDMPFRKMGTPMRLTDHFYTTMAVDLDVYDEDGPLASIDSHPDKDGATALNVRNNLDGYLDAKWVGAGWRGKIDMNQALWDGSVHQFSDVRWAEVDQDDNADRFSDIPWQADTNWSQGALNFWGENGSRGRFEDPTRPPITFNPDAI